MNLTNPNLPPADQSTSPRNVTPVPILSSNDVHNPNVDVKDGTSPADHPQAASTFNRDASQFEGSDTAGNQSSSDRQGGSVAVPSLGENILDGIARLSTASHDGIDAAWRSRLQQTVELVAQQIFVSEASESTDHRVHIVLKDSILPETEVAVSRDGATLTVRFITRSDESAQLLTTHQRSLQDQLSQTLDRPVSVDVSAEQEDGRSRGQRDALEEWEEEHRR